MPKSLSCKWRGLMCWLLAFFVLVPSSVWAAAKISTSERVAQFEYAGTILLLAAIMAGGITAMFIPTNVDGQIKKVAFAKWFIGMTFGLFASLFVSSRCHLDDVQMLLPGYFLAAIGTPIMVYVVGIASDKDTYATLVTWFKRKFGLGG